MSTLTHLNCDPLQLPPTHHSLMTLKLDSVYGHDFGLCHSDYLAATFTKSYVLHVKTFAVLVENVCGEKERKTNCVTSDEG